MIRIVFFVPHPDILPIIGQVSRERPESEAIQYEVVQDSYNDRLEQAKADVVITRGFTAHILKHKNIPCAEFKSTGYDVMKAIDECMQKGNIGRAAVVGASNVVYGIEQTCHLYLNLGLGCYVKDDETKLEMATHQAIKDGNQAIVGGYSMAQTAERLSMPAAMIHSGIEAISHIISETVVVAHPARYERQKRDEIADIMNYSLQGIIPVNKKGITTLANTCCHTCMKDGKTSLAGEHIENFFPDTGPDSATRDKQEILSEVCRFGGRQMPVNYVPMAGDSEEFGRVFTFQGMEQIQAEEGKLHKRMHSDGFTVRYDFSHIPYGDGYMEAVISRVAKFSHSDSNILIHGEAGTGKELFAQNTHNSSRRRKGPFVVINCTVLSENPLESELFGYVEGVFTGVFRGGKMGFLEIVHKRTIFLDKIGDIPSKLQSRLLRIMQERRIIRLDNDTVTPIGTRIIRVTNRDLKKEVFRGNSRGGLLYYLDVFELNPSLPGKRKQGILYLADRMVRFEHEYAGSRLEAIAQEGGELLMYCNWSGNVREMRNFRECIRILYERTRAGAEGVLQALPGKWEYGKGVDSQYTDSQYAES